VRAADDVAVETGLRLSLATGKFKKYLDDQVSKKNLPPTFAQIAVSAYGESGLPKQLPSWFCATRQKSVQSAAGRSAPWRAGGGRGTLAEEVEERPEQNRGRREGEDRADR
jgi:hypothetical protein